MSTDWRARLARDVVAAARECGLDLLYAADRHGCDEWMFRAPTYDDVEVYVCLSSWSAGPDVVVAGSAGVAVDGRFTRDLVSRVDLPPSELAGDDTPWVTLLLEAHGRARWLEQRVRAAAAEGTLGSLMRVAFTHGTARPVAVPA